MLGKLLRAIGEEGAVRSAQRVASYVQDIGFDRRHGLDTARVVELHELELCERDREHGNPYMATRVRHSRHMLRSLDIPPRSVFVDFGCGKGRVLCLASAEGAFDRVVGVEFSAELADIARRNLVRYRARHRGAVPATVVTANALDFEIEPEHNVFYVFRSFDRSVAEPLVRRLEASWKEHPRRMILVFSYYVYGDMMDGVPAFRPSATLVYGGAEFTVFETEG